MAVAKLSLEQRIKINIAQVSNKNSNVNKKYRKMNVYAQI